MSDSRVWSFTHSEDFKKRLKRCLSGCKKDGIEGSGGYVLKMRNIVVRLPI